MGNLSVGEILERTCSELEKKFKNKLVIFPEPVYAEIANDSDWHRTRVGYMRYEKADLFQFNNKEWAIARGVACGGYPADPYSGDISALEFSSNGKLEKGIREELMNNFRGCSYFRNSIVYGMSDGCLAVNKKSEFGIKIVDILKPNLKEYMTYPEIDNRYFTMDLRPVVRSAASYKKEFVGVLVDGIVKILSEG